MQMPTGGIHQSSLSPATISFAPRLLLVLKEAQEATNRQTYLAYSAQLASYRVATRLLVRRKGSKEGVDCILLPITQQIFWRSNSIHHGLSIHRELLSAVVPIWMKPQS